jgi:hypothetical protein
LQLAEVGGSRGWWRRGGGFAQPCVSRRREARGPIKEACSSNIFSLFSKNMSFFYLFRRGVFSEPIKIGHENVGL